MDQYEITEKVDGDFNNSVFFATHKVTAAQVVIKEIHSGKYKKDAQNHGIAEGQAHELCKSDSVIRLVEHFKENGFYYLVTSRAKYGSLLNYQGSIANETCLSEDHARQIFKQIVHGVEHIHSQGIVHRDLKHLNILVSKADPTEVKITDFGIAM